MNYNYEKQHN